MPIPILRAKLYRPPIDGAHLHRGHLTDRLDQGRHRPLSLVSAPAGYGKTTLVSCWLENCDVPGAWVSLDEKDNEIRIFLSYFISAIQHIFHGKRMKNGWKKSGSPWTYELNLPRMRLPKRQ